MADYGLFVSHLRQEDDLVTVELNEIERLENEIKQVKKEGAEERKRIEKDFRKKWREAETYRQAVEDGSDEDLRGKIEEYETVERDYKANWDGRLSMLKKFDKSYKNGQRIVKLIIIYSLIASVFFGLGAVMMYELERTYSEKINKLDDYE